MEDTRASTQLLKMVTALHGTRERKAGVAPRTPARVMRTSFRAGRRSSSSRVPPRTVEHDCSYSAGRSLATSAFCSRRELLRRRLRRLKCAGFPILEEALYAYPVVEFESPRLVANAQDITLDGHLVEGHVE